MRAILISIKPEWVEKILNKEKILEIRKSIPKCDLPCKVYIYCTHGKMLHDMKNESYWNSKRFALADLKSNNIVSSSTPFINGKVVADFTLKTTEEFECCSDDFEWLVNHTRCCLSMEEVLDYCKGQDLYGWYIDDLIIYEKPKELSEFIKPLNENCDTCFLYPNMCENVCRKVKRPPQSYMYVEELI